MRSLMRMPRSPQPASVTPLGEKPQTVVADLEATMQQAFEDAMARQEDEFDAAEESRAAGAAARSARFCALVEDVRACFERAQAQRAAECDAAHEQHVRATWSGVERRQVEFMDQARTHDALFDRQLGAFEERAKTHREVRAKLEEEAHGACERRCADLKESLVQSLERAVKAQDALFVAAEETRDAAVRARISINEAPAAGKHSDISEMFKESQRSSSRGMRNVPVWELNEAPQSQAGSIGADISDILSEHNTGQEAQITDRDATALDNAIQRSTSPAADQILTMPMPQRGRSIPPSPRNSPPSPPRIVRSPKEEPTPSRELACSPLPNDPHGQVQPGHNLLPEVGTARTGSTNDRDRESSVTGGTAREVCERNEDRRDALMRETEAARTATYDAAEAQRDGDNGRMGAQFAEIMREQQKQFDAGLSARDGLARALHDVAARKSDQFSEQFASLQARRGAAFRALLSKEWRMSETACAAAARRIAALREEIEYMREAVLQNARARREVVFEERQRSRDELLGVKQAPASPGDFDTWRRGPVKYAVAGRRGMGGGWRGPASSPPSSPLPSPRGQPIPEETRRSPAIMGLPLSRHHTPGLVPSMLLDIKPGLTTPLPVVEAVACPSTPTPHAGEDALRELEQWCVARQAAREATFAKAARQRQRDFSRCERARAQEFEADQNARVDSAAKQRAAHASRHVRERLARETRLLEAERGWDEEFAAGQASRDWRFAKESEDRAEEFGRAMEKIWNTSVKAVEVQSTAFDVWAREIQRVVIEDEVSVARFFELEELERQSRFQIAMSTSTVRQET